MRNSTIHYLCSEPAHQTFPCVRFSLFNRTEISRASKIRKAENSTETLASQANLSPTLHKAIKVSFPGLGCW